MKNKLKCIIALVLTIGTISISTSAMAESEITVFIDGTKVDFDVAPIIYEERTLVPMRAIFEALGAEVSWNQETKTASAARGNDTVSIAIDSNQLYKNNKAVKLDVPAKIIGGRTLVPVRAISESFDADVKWDGNTQRVTITTALIPTPSPSVAPDKENAKVIELTDSDFDTLKEQKEISRYQFEQKDLPKFMFDNSDKLYGMISNTPEKVSEFGSAVYDVWDKSVASLIIDIMENSEHTYEIAADVSEDDLIQSFSKAAEKAEIDAESIFTGVTCLESDNGTKLGVVIFKFADSLVQCKYLCIAVAKDSKPRYFTAENDIMENDKWFFCEVQENGRGTIGAFDKADEKKDFDNFINIAAKTYEKSLKPTASVKKQ